MKPLKSPSGWPAFQAPYIEPHSEAFHQNPYPTYKLLQLLAPVTYWEQGQAWLVTRYADVVTILHDRRFSAHYTHWRHFQVTEFEQQVWPVLERNDLHHLSMADNRRLREAVLSYFVGKNVDFVRQKIQAICDQKQFRMYYRRQFDLVSDFADGVSLRVIAYLFAIPEEEIPTFVRFARAYVGLLDPALAGTPDQTQERIGDLKRGFKLIGDIIRLQRNPGGGELLIDHLIDRCDRHHQLLESELPPLVAILAGEGLDTARLLIANTVYRLLTHHAVPQLEARPALWANAVQEVLRYDYPLKLGTPRYALTDCVIDGARIARGDRIYPVIAAAHRDPAVFARPDEFDITRDTESVLESTLGTHSFIGMNLARWEAEVATRHLIESLPQLRITAPPSYDPHHRTLRAMTSLKMASSMAEGEKE